MSNFKHNSLCCCSINLWSFLLQLSHSIFNILVNQIRPKSFSRVYLPFYNCLHFIIIFNLWKWITKRNESLAIFFKSLVTTLMVIVFRHGKIFQIFDSYILLIKFWNSIISSKSSDLASFSFFSKFLTNFK